MRKKVSRFAVLLLLLNFVLMNLSAQIPYVYNVENTGTGYPAPPLPTLANCPVIEPLPDPFAWANEPLGSTRSTAFSDWSHHRAEIKAQIENYEIGTKPAVDPSQVTASFENGTLTVNVTVGDTTITLSGAITLPDGDGPFPIVIGMNGNSLPATAFTSRNIARITFNANQVTTYGNPQNTNPYYRLYPDQNIDNSGQYAAWSWGVSRLIDGLYLTQANNKIDVAHIAVTGCSYAGKMALFAGAFDERVALTIPQESGGGGVASWRYSYTQSGVEGLAQTDHNWFKESMFNFGNENVSKLPVDHHMLCAMVAPRALYITGNASQTWLSNEACYVSSRAVQQIYSTLGIADRFGFAITDGHAHCSFPASQNESLAYFLDKFLKDSTALSETIETAPSDYATVDYARWTQWWGTGDPILPPLPFRPNAEGTWLEAECGIIGSEWRVGTNPLASSGKYIVGDTDNHTPPRYDDAKSAVYNFTVAEAARYNVLIRVHCQTADDDSYHVKIDNGSFSSVNSLTTGDDWKWLTLVPNANLTAGEHTLTIVFRENGAELDKIVITTSSFASEDVGEDATNCIPPPLVYDRENTGADCTVPTLPAPADLPSVVRLPNPFEFEFSNGQKVVNTIADWECRRNEIKAEIEQYEIGIKPTRPVNITAAYAANVLTITVVENGQTLTLTPRVTMPATGTGPFPVVIGISGATGSLPASLFANCIQINYNPGQVATDGQAHTGAFYTMYPEVAGHYSAWSWGVSRLIDGLELVQAELNADLAHIGITGCSRYGKLALFGGAFDERIALTIAQEPGGGGAAAWRVSEALGNVEKIDNTDYSWFLSSMRDNFKGKVDRLPHDHHELIAMIAPRAVLVLGNDGIDWLADPSGYVSCMAAREVWKKFGVEDRMGFDFTGGHNHCAAPESQTDAAGKFIQRFLYGDNTVDTEILTSPYQNVNYQFWIKDWANVTEPTVVPESFWYEPETTACGTLGSDLAVDSDANASGGKYVTAGSGLSSTTAAPDINGQLKITFDTENHGNGYVFIRVNYSDVNSNTFWAKIDDDDFVLYDYLNNYGEWQWIPLITGRPLPKGTHTFTIAYAEAGAKLDRILITNDPTVVQTSGFGGAENDCEPPKKYIKLDFENGNIDGWSKLNPGAGIDITQEDKYQGSYALKMTNGSGSSAWSVQVTTPDIEIHSGHIYTLTFWVRAVGGGGRGRISTAGAGALGGTYWADFNVGDAWQQITYNNLTASGSSVKLAFDMGYVANKTYFIDDIIFDDTNMDDGGTGIKQIYTSWSGKIYSSEKRVINVIAPANSEVQIVDILGRIAGTSKISNSTLQFSVNSSGIYVVSVKDGNKIHTQKVAVK
ncbi:MAG: carbohydrate binding domain-containing protein [Dysgonamonadaceae bacterium]|jgi:hypothetical protein|nr:carbohydrate binding domain-containing protein [Dysgonamonadaceae bacterium]